MTGGRYLAIVAYCVMHDCVYKFVITVDTQLKLLTKYIRLPLSANFANVLFLSFTEWFCGKCSMR